MERPSLKYVLPDIDCFKTKFQYIRNIYDTKYSNTSICKNNATGQILVLKENTNQKYFYQLQREIMLVRKLNHDGIVKIIDYNINEERKKCYIIIPYYKNGDLFDFYQTNPTFFTVGKVIEIIRKLIIIVKNCHDNNICHRDIKLENILLNNDFFQTLSITLIDFGLSVEKHGDQFIMNEICGSPDYMAPEILSYDESYYSEKCDVWSIGVILYFFLYKRFPFEYNDVNSLRLRINSINVDYSSCTIEIPELVDLLKSMLHKDPEYRITLHDALRHDCFSYAI